MLKSLWKRCWKMTFTHCFGHNFWSTDHFFSKVCLIGKYTSWASIWIQILPNLSLIWVSYYCLKLGQLDFLGFKMKGPKHNVLMWVGLWTLKNIQRSLKSLKILRLTYKYSSYASNQNPNQRDTGNIMKSSGGSNEALSWHFFYNI